MLPSRSCAASVIPLGELAAMLESTTVCMLIEVLSTAPVRTLGGGASAGGLSFQSYGTAHRSLRSRQGNGRRIVPTNPWCQNGWAQYSTGRLLPRLTISSCGERGADACVTSP